MDTNFKVMKLKQLFRYLLTLILLVGGTAVFAQKTMGTRYNNDGKPIRGGVALIGNRSDAPYNLNIPSTDPNCRVRVKKALLYWGGHAGGGNMDIVRLKGPNGLNKVVTKNDGHTESNAIVWDEADYLVYRLYFDQYNGRDLDIPVQVS